MPTGTTVEIASRNRMHHPRGRRTLPWPRVFFSPSLHAPEFPGTDLNL